MEWTRREMMVIAAAREIKDKEVVFVGTYWPLLSVRLAKLLHAPNIFVVVEGGVIRSKPCARMPLMTTDPAISESSVLCGDMFDTLGTLMHGQRADISLINAAIVDKYGNVNTTCIGEYKNPKVKLPGSGGACEFGCFSKKMIIVLEHDKRRFPEKVDFITTPGYLSGKKEREECGLPRETGPFSVITTIGVFRFTESGEMYLFGRYEGVSLEEAKDSVQWDLLIPDPKNVIEPPTEDELYILREKVDPEKMFLEDERLGRYK